MFGTYKRSIGAYQDVGTTSAVEGADPHKLIALLFEGAIAAIAVARGAMEQNRVADKGRAISKAIDIIENGLMASLNVEQGGELAGRLGALYDYMCERLLFANLKNSVAALDEVSGLLGNIQQAWAQIRSEVAQSDSDNSP